MGRYNSGDDQARPAVQAVDPTRRSVDQELAARESTLHAEAAELLDELDRSGVFADLGALALAGSYVSGLMCWPEVDVMLLVGADYSPVDVLRLISRIIELPGVVGFDYRDERAGRSPTGTVRDERYHLPILLERGSEIWCLDLTLWLNDLHPNIAAWHEHLRDSITDEQRAAVLRIKDVWCRLPSYPHEIGGLEIYQAVIEDGVRTPEQFGEWLAGRGLPGT